MTIIVDRDLILKIDSHGLTLIFHPGWTRDQKILSRELKNSRNFSLLSFEKRGQQILAKVGRITEFRKSPIFAIKIPRFDFPGIGFFWIFHWGLLGILNPRSSNSRGFFDLAQNEKSSWKGYLKSRQEADLSLQKKTLLKRHGTLIFRDEKWLRRNWRVNVF